VHVLKEAGRTGLQALWHLAGGIAKNLRWDRQVCRFQINLAMWMRLARQGLAQAARPLLAQLRMEPLPEYS
jgi:hypothetical protein